jgi:hypothetical protein
MNNSKLWGPYFWSLLHNITVLYPNNPSELDEEMIRKIINSYKYLLPCDKCKNHFKKNLKSFPISSYDNETKKTFLSSKNGVIRWGIIIHNMVNKMLDKSESINNNNSGISNIKHKYEDIDTIYIFKIVLKYIISSINDIDEVQIYLSNLFNGVFHFLLYKKIDLKLNLKRKNIPINFNKKKYILTIIDNLQ